jgi:hypothetical protein
MSSCFCLKKVQSRSRGLQARPYLAGLGENQRRRRSKAEKAGAVGDGIQSVSFYCAVAARAHFEISNVHMYYFELQHYENHVTKKYAHINNNRLS